MSAFPQNLYVRILTPQSEDVRMWELWEVTGPEYAALLNGMRSLMKQTPTEFPDPFHRRRISREVRDSEEDPHLSMRGPWSWTSSLQNQEWWVSLVCKPPIVWYGWVTGWRCWKSSQWMLRPGFHVHVWHKTCASNQHGSNTCSNQLGSIYLFF